MPEAKPNTPPVAANRALPHEAAPPHSPHRRGLVSRIRLKALLWTGVIAVATFATIALTSLSWVPVLGAAIAAAVVSVNKVASRLDHPHCWQCGTDLSDTSAGAYGRVCPGCGRLNQHGSPR